MVDRDSAADGRLMRAHGVSRSYGKLLAVETLDLSIDSGEVLGLLGPNGAGKTTTLSMIAGVLAPDEGTIEIGGVDLEADPVAARARIGYLPEHPPLYPELTVDEYLEYCGRLRGLRGPRLAAALDETIERCALVGERRRLIGNLSKGFQQRVGIAQAVVHGPSLVLLDEPTAGLDPIQIVEIRSLVRELGRGHGVVLSTHILPEVQETCDRVAILSAGRLVLDSRLELLGGEPEEHWTRAVFAGRPAREDLAAIPGVVEVREAGAGCWRLRHGPDGIGDGLLERSLAGGWRLRELSPEQRSLEEVFVELTCGDTATGAEEVR